MDQKNFPELNTESDTTLEQPDLDQLRLDRLERNRTFLRSVSGSTAARVFTKDESNRDVQKSAAIIIQKNWRRVLARNVYVAMLYEKYMKEEEEQKQRTRQQMEEGALLVENHELEVLLDDNKTTRRNAERRLISKVITIQRAWKAYQERKKHISLINPNERDNSGDRADEIQGHTNNSLDTFHSNKRSARSNQGNPDTDKPNKSSDNHREESSKETVYLADNDSCFVNPISEHSNGVNATSDKIVLKQLPKETDEDFQRRLRKHSVLTQAQRFMLLKKENSNVLPFNLHAYDKQDPATECTHNQEEQNGEINMVVTSECTVCDLNRKESTRNLLNGSEVECLVSDKVVGESGSKNRSMDMEQSKNNNPDTKGGKCENPNEKGDNKTGDEVLSAFDVYNIETALPDIDWKNIEEKLSAARKEEEERLKARRNDREEIRKKLAMGADDDDFYDDNDDDDDISYKKPNLQSRLHSGLQICFMNESPGDTDSEGLSPRQHEIHDNMKLMSKGDDLVDSDNNLKSVTDLNRTAAGTSQEKSSNSPPRLKEKTTTDQPAKCDDFHSRQEQLQEEAKLALAQAGTMARMQLEIEKQTQTKSPMAEMVGIPGLGERRRKKLGLRKLQEMNLAQIQVLYNDLQTQIENLNEELVHLLMERDELHMEQDSMLVDIEDLTRRAEELAEKSNAKAAAKNSKNHVTGKVGGR